MVHILRYRSGRRERGALQLPFALVASFALGVVTVLATELVDLSGFHVGTEPAAGGDSVSVAFVVCIHGRPANCVVDGDTIRHEGVVIRVADIDTPEVFSPRCAAEAALGARATERMLALVNAGPFEIARSGNRDEDVYGRKLRILARDGHSFGEILVAEGLAHVWDGSKHPWCEANG